MCGFHNSTLTANLAAFECYILSSHHGECCHFVSVLVDKDNTPKWQPSTLDAVSKGKVESYFETLGDRELVL